MFVFLFALHKVPYLYDMILASYFRTSVRNGYNTVLLDEIYVDLRILTYIEKWDVPCLVVKPGFTSYISEM